ncbi:FecR family protein [Spirosoma rhododendri]|uniref:FecR domain-containing protein n=1 Tax=Spirosoma rhododendri TaxID=2728024 RepID=A0A7L5DLH5_9BACT|nr:FecR domain-containing protein [Spirosoma rhododendri]QJD78945.1 FecR domain-containing protein [Spirosoma rhododendri]
MPQKPYSAYTAEEFALDDLFVRWVKHPHDEEVAMHWQLWLNHNPARRHTVESARQLILHSALAGSDGLANDEISSLWGRIRESLQGMEDVRPLQPKDRTMVGWWYFGRTVAATLGVVLLIGWALWIQYGPHQSQVVIRTGNEPERAVQLPDGSQVQLHANSQLRYDRQGFTDSWSDETPRAVWLDGEADFTVAHRPAPTTDQRFRVHTSNLTVEATGTVFHIRHCAKGTKVALTSGAVNLLVNRRKPIQLRPGQTIEVAAGLARPLP